MVQLQVWVVVENNTVCLAATIPALRPLLMTVSQSDPSIYHRKVAVCPIAIITRNPSQRAFGDNLDSDSRTMWINAPRLLLYYSAAGHISSSDGACADLPGLTLGLARLASDIKAVH
jgi:hypothetical protein